MLCGKTISTNFSPMAPQNCLLAFICYFQKSNPTADIIISPFSLHVRLNQKPWGPVRIQYQGNMHIKKLYKWRDKWERIKCGGAEKLFSLNSMYLSHNDEYWTQNLKALRKSMHHFGWKQPKVHVLTLKTEVFKELVKWMPESISLPCCTVRLFMLETIAFLPIRTSEDGKIGEKKVQGIRSTVVNYGGREKQMGKAMPTQNWAVWSGCFLHPSVTSVVKVKKISCCSLHAKPLKRKKIQYNNNREEKEKKEKISFPANRLQLISNYWCFWILF